MNMRELQRFERFVRETPKLYEIAKQVTLDAGFPYTDPRTGIITQPPKGKTKMQNARKKPKWVLLDQLHIDVNISSDMPAKERKELLQLLNYESFHNMITAVISGANRKNIKVKISR